MRLETYTCDGCGSAKGAGNRWLMGWKVDGGFALADWGFAPSGQSNEGTKVYHFCSESHALIELAKHLRQDKVGGHEVKVNGPVPVKLGERKIAS